jgi:hypothetical protein
MDKDKYQRQNPRYREYRDRRDESILQRIKNDVKAWFEDDDEDEKQTRSYQDEEYSSYDYQGNEHEGNLRRQRSRSYGNRSEESGWEPSEYSSSYGSSESRHGTGTPRYRSGLGSSGQSNWPEDRFGGERFEDERNRGYESGDFRSSGRESRNRQQRSPYVVYAEYWATSGPYSGIGPKGFRRSASGLKERICERLESAGDIDASDVDVQVENDEVTLTGTVRDRRQKRLVEDCVESVYGIRDIHNQLRVAGKSESGSAESGFSSSVGTSGTDLGRSVTDVGKSGDDDKESSTKSAGR